MNATPQPAATPALAETLRLHKDGQEIAFTFERDFGGMVQVSEDGAKPARWDFAWASRELVTRVRLGWTLAPVVAG